MYWKGFGTTIEISMMAKTWTPKAKGKLKNEPTKTVKTLTGTIKMNAGFSFTTR